MIEVVSCAQPLVTQLIEQLFSFSIFIFFININYNIFQLVS